LIALIRYQLAVLGHSQRYLPPALLYVGLLAWFYSDNSSDVVLPGFALTAGALLVIAGWLTIALVDVEDPVQRLITRSHTGSMLRLTVGTVATVLACSTALAGLSMAWAWVSHGGRYAGSEIGIGTVAHLVCASVGIAVALPCSRLVIRRIGYTMIAAVTAFGVVLLVKWVPLVFPLLLALTSNAAGPAVLIQSAAAGALAVTASPLLVVAWCTRQD
jgi:hypothetical protein